MTTKNEARYIVATSLAEMAERWDKNPDHKFTGREVAEVLRKTSADLMLLVATHGQSVGDEKCHEG
jgi:hypothetical protein